MREKTCCNTGHQYCMYNIQQKPTSFAEGGRQRVCNLFTFTAGAQL